MPEGSLSRSPIPLLAFLGAFLAIVPGTARGQEASGSGIIRGQLFTAQHSDSVAGGAELTLIYRRAGTEIVERITAIAASDGTYQFAPVSADPAIGYVIKVHHFGRDFLGAPISFEPGRTLLEFNFLVARDAKPIPQIDGHPPMDEGMGAHLPPPLPPVRQDPLAAVGIVAGVLALFALPLLLSRSRSSDRPRRLQGAAVDLMRDIASLDLRFADGDLLESDYRKIRASLFEKLEERSGGSRPASLPLR